MTVLVKLSTTLRDHVPRYTPDPGLEVDISPLGPEPTAASLATLVGLPTDEIKIVMINGRQAALSSPVRDGDRIAYFPAVGGG